MSVKHRRFLWFVMSSLLLVCFIMASTAALSQAYDAEKERSFYKNKVMVIVVPSKAGGWFDRWARLIAPALQERLPGASVVVDNVPGGGGRIASNKLWTSKPDGRTIAVVNRSNSIIEFTKQRGVRYKFADFTWLGNTINQARFLFVGVKTPYKKIEDLLNSKTVIKIGCSGVGTVAYNDSLMIKRTWKLDNLTIVPGYEGNNDVYRAILQGEIEGMIALENDAVNRPSEEITILLQMGGPKGYVPGINVPTFSSIVPEHGKAFGKFLEQQFYLSRAWAAPPGMDPDRTRFLRDTFEEICKDPKFIASVEKAGARVDFTPGEKVRELARIHMNQPPEVVELFMPPK